MERADYRNWSFNTLRRLAEAMDARIRVLIEPAEDVLHEYDPQQISAPDFVLDMRDMNKLLDAIIRSRGTSSTPITVEEPTAAERPSARTAATAKTKDKQEPSLLLSVLFPSPLGQKQASDKMLEGHAQGATWN